MPSPSAEPPAALKPSRHTVLLLLLKMQLAYIILALLWGFFRSIPWWKALHWNLGLVGGAALGLGLAALSHELFGRLAERFESVRWLREECMGPIARVLSPGGKLLVALASGFGEEVLFRGILLTELGLIPSSLLFALLHLGDRRMVWMAGWAFLTALLMGGLVLLTGNLALAVVIHFCNNYASFWLLHKTGARS
ncbi:CPBP family intramembrane metalloprotease [bacterium CPR1]|nr:CPBP family intramembrane metalloprotease [bacterium CPR1]